MKDWTNDDKELLKLAKQLDLKVIFVEIKKHKGDKECDVIIHKVEKK
jgi:hypothetical protein